MALIRGLLLVLSFFIYSASAVTNLEVSRALKAFDSTLQLELCALNKKLIELENLILDNIERTCNPGSCSVKTCPDPVKEVTSTPTSVEPTTPTPVKPTTTPTPVEPTTPAPISDNTPVPCTTTSDLVVILDSSASIGDSGYELAKTFVAQLSKAFTPYAKNRFSLVTFSSRAVLTIKLDSGLNPGEIESKILNTPYQMGGTATALAIDMATKELVNNKRNVPMTFVVLTDGGSANRYATVTAAENAIRQGIRTISVGIGSGVDNTELLNIAGNQPENVHTLKAFDQLTSVLGPISKEICPTSA